MNHNNPPPDIDHILKFFNLDGDFSDLGPENLAAIPQSQWLNCMSVTPPPAIQRYIDSGDTLSQHTLDMMELAMERAFGVEAPWYITCVSSGDEENQTLKVNDFLLMKEPVESEADLKAALHKAILS